MQRFVAFFATTFCASLASATTVGPVTELSATPPNAPQRAPVAAWDGTRYVVAFEDGRSTGNGTEIYLARIDADGSLVDLNGLPVLSPPQPGDQTQPSIAFSPITMNFILTWTDPRAGSADIYAARFFPMGPGTVPEPGGIQLTIGADAESSPSIGCANQSCLIAFQANTVGGGIEVRGLRILPTGDPHDPSPIELVPDTAGQTAELSPEVLALPGGFILAWEDDRNNGTGQLGSDLFFQTLPDIAPMTATTGAALVSANLRQSAISLAVFNQTDVLAVWQDQRSGTSTAAGDDIWRGIFTQALGPVGPLAELNSARNSQIFPRVAAGAGHAMAVWEDFRSGGFGLTFGTVIDVAGAPRQRDAFPLIAFNANMIEQTVTKGPGDDYLVMSVRSTPFPPRIYYRIVREEPPMGTMTPTGTLRVPANGTSVAQVTFGPAQGASGFGVIDGTLYTVELSRAADLSVPDADTSMTGHQIPAIDGNLSFGLTTLSPGVVTITVSSVEGASTGMVDVTFDNVAPTVTNVRIEPAVPTSSEDLVVRYDYADVNSDPEGATQIQWTRNSALQPGFNNQATVPANAINRGELWRARVRPFDGTDFGDFVFSSDVLVLNTAPRAIDVRIEPNVDVKTATMLAARYRFDDPDSDAEMGSSLTWYERGVEQAALANTAQVPAAMVVKGQQWRFTILPSDGSNPGQLVSSATVAIVNSVPVADAGTNGTVVERRTYTLSGSGSSDLDPQDNLTYRWVQLNADPIVQLSDVTSSTPTFTAPSISSTAMLQFGLTVSDGESTSAQATVVVLVSPVADADADGLDDEEEMVLGTDPMRGDTDRDGIKDGDEVAGGSLPLDEDSDDDGVRDGDEVSPFEDTDMDTKLNVLDHDSDNDGLFDGLEQGITGPLAGTDESAGQFAADADRMSTTNPLVADTDGDMLADGVEDANKNGRVDLGESDPNDPTSKVGCNPDMTCPGDLVCERNACRAAAPSDGGIMCLPLAEVGSQCCMGAQCASATVVAAICNVQGNREQCPAGARQCPLSACQPATPPPKTEGCSCTVRAPTRTGAPASGLLVLVGLALLRSRRRPNGR